MIILILTYVRELTLGLRILILCDSANHSSKETNPRSDRANRRSKGVNTNLRKLTLVLLLHKKANFM